LSAPAEKPSDEQPERLQGANNAEKSDPSADPVPLRLQADPDDPQAPIAPALTSGSGLLFAGAAGGVLLSCIESATSADAPPLMATAADYPELWNALVSTQNVRSDAPAHPRVFIWGPYEARLQDVDLCVLGSLNDGTWPEIATGDAWLNRAMRSALGLPAPEYATGLASHDFCQLLGQGEIILTRAARVDGAPTTRSRWLTRLDVALQANTADGRGLEPVTQPRWLAWADALQRAPSHQPCARPAPAPPLHVRPRRLAVTRVSTLAANPYDVFAREILGLEPLDGLRVDPGAGLRGNLVHDVLHHYAALISNGSGDVGPGAPNPGAPNPNARETMHPALMAYARSYIADLGVHPRIEQFWLPRLDQFLSWFLSNPAAGVAAGDTVLGETSARLELQGPAGPFTLTARADRIDLTPMGGLRLIDYKSGAIPSRTHVLDLRAPQLPLQIAMLKAGAFSAVNARADIVAEGRSTGTGGQPTGQAGTADASAPITIQSAEYIRATG
ncbi:MAG: PD-(D/E)XK nuclease family protein, partial [Pseudomonadota bacterium]